MKDPSRTKQALIEENFALKQRIRELEHLEAERKRVEEALQESENRLREITTQIPGVVYQFYVKPSGAMGFYYVSDRSEHVLGLKSDLEGYFERFSAIVIPEHRDGFIKSIEKSVKEVSEWKYEGMLQKPSGEIIWFSGNSTPSLREDEIVFNGIVRDISDRKWAEEELQLSEERFRLLVRNSSDIMGIVDPDGNQRYVSDAAERITGFPASELASKNISEVIHPDDFLMVLEAFQGCLAHPDTLMRVEYRYIHKTKGWVHFEAIGQSFIDDPSVRGVITNVRDITEHKNIEMKLLESERMFRSIVENSCAAIYTSDNNFRFSYVNDQLCEMSGYSRGEILGMDLRQLIAEESLPIISDRYTKRRKGEDVPSWYEFTGVRKDGEQRFLEASTAVVMDNSGGAITIGQILDITERKQAEEALQQSEERFRLLAENARDAIWTMDMNLQYTYISPSVKQIVDYSPEELMSKPLNEMMTEPSLKACIKAFAEELEIEKKDDKDLLRSRTLEIEHISKHGERVWAEVKITFIRSATGQATGILGITRDISERKLAEEELRKSEKYFRAITENAADVLFIVDVQGMVTYCSPSVERILGYRPEELIGISGFDLIIPEDQPRAFEDFSKASLTTEVEVPNSFRIRHKNGTVLTMEGIGKNLYHDPIIAGFVMNIRDVTERRRTEEAIRTSEERSRLIAENAKVVIWMMDMNLRYTYMSPFIKLSLDYTPEEFFVKPLHEVMTPSSFELCMRLFAEELEEENKPGRDLSRSRTIEVEHIHRDGRIIPAEINMTFIRDAAGNALGILGITSDITDKKHAEAVLRNSERRYRQLIDQAADGIFVMDNNGDYLLVNKKFCEMLNYQEDELLKLNVIDTYPDELKDIGRQRIQSVNSGDSLRFERPMKRKDGTFFRWK